MARLEDLSPGTVVEGVKVDGPVTVVSVQWFCQSAVELTHKVESTGSVGNQFLHRADEQRLESWKEDNTGLLTEMVTSSLWWLMPSAYV
jgi:hypothetical protein